MHPYAVADRCPNSAADFFRDPIRGSHDSDSSRQCHADAVAFDPVACFEEELRNFWSVKGTRGLAGASLSNNDQTAVLVDVVLDFFF